MSDAPLTRYDRSFFLTSKHLPESLTARLREAVAGVARDWPSLPAADDRETVMAPTGVVWLRRRIGASSWWVHYSATAEGIIVRSVNDLG